MNYKQSDFFIGIVDFFAVFLPGALMAFLLLTLTGDYLLENFPIFPNTSDVTRPSPKSRLP